LKITIRQTPGHGPGTGLGNEKLDAPVFDSDLDLYPYNPSKNAALQITLYISFNQINKSTHGNKFGYPGQTPVKIRDWPGFKTGNQPWIAWKAEALKQINRIWNNAIWLEPPKFYTGLDVPKDKPTHRPYVACALKCDERTSSYAHVKVNVVFLDPSDPNKWRSDFTHWSNKDNAIRNESSQQIPGEVIPYYVCAHEVGHLLGLHHIGEPDTEVGLSEVGMCKQTPPAGYSATQKDLDCYADNATAAPWKARNVMGSGSIVHDVNCKPWIRRMVEHTEGATAKTGWKAWGTSFGPRPL
jgi:hypothetical protein